MQGSNLPIITQDVGCSPQLFPCGTLETLFIGKVMWELVLYSPIVVPKVVLLYYTVSYSYMQKVLITG
jgi:hypothetical protein